LLISDHLLSDVPDHPAGAITQAKTAVQNLPARPEGGFQVGFTQRRKGAKTQEVGLLLGFSALRLGGLA